MGSRNLRVLIALAGGKALTMPLMLLTTILVGRLLGPRGLGQWTLIGAAGLLLHTTLVNWTHASTVRFGSEEWASTGTLRRTFSARLPLVALSACVALALLVAQPGSWLQRWFAVDAGRWWLVALYALSVWLAAEAQATLQATDRIVVQAWLAPTVAACSLALVASMLWFEHRSIVRVTIALTMVPIAIWGSAWVFSLRRAVAGIERPASGDIGRQLRYSWPLLPTFIVGYISDWGDHLLLGRFASVSEVGVFGVAYQVFGFILAANALLTTTVLPRLTVQQMQDPKAMSLYLRDVVPTLLTLWMIGSIWVAVLVPSLLAFAAGDAFRNSVVVVIVLCVVIPASIVTSLYTVLFNIQERLGVGLIYSVAISSTNVALSLLLIPSYGALGAAVGTIVSYLLGQLMYVTDQHRWLEASPVVVLSLWASGLLAGLLQAGAGGSLPGRILSGVAATMVVVLVSRRTRSVNALLVTGLFHGRARGVATVINHALVSRPSSVGAC